MVKLQKSCAGFVKRKYSSIEEIVLLKWLLILDQIDYTVLKLIFTRILNERMPPKLKIVIQKKQKKNENLKKYTDTLKLMLINGPN